MWLISIFARWGVSERLRRPLAWLVAAMVLIALLWTLGAIFAARESADDTNNQQIGAAVQREGDLHETIKRVEKADEILDQVRAPGSRLRYDECLRSARTPANCQRFLPD